MRRTVRPTFTPTQARFVMAAVRRAHQKCSADDERRTWGAAIRALAKAIEAMRAEARQ